MTNVFAKMLNWEVLHMHSMYVDRWWTRGTRPPTYRPEEMSSHFTVHKTNF